MEDLEVVTTEVLEEDVEEVVEVGEVGAMEVEVVGVEEEELSNAVL